jgi:hypothetical protein
VKENSLVPDYKHYIEHQLQNPISQAFGLLLERIPGFTPSMIVKCPSKPTTMDGSLEADKMLDAYLGFRENIAAQLLFNDCLKKFENSSRRNALYNMFGTGVKVTTSSSTLISRSTTQSQVVAPSTRGKPKVAPAGQKTISSFLMDSFIVDNIRKKERAAAAAAKKKLKEQAEAEDSD